MSFRYPGAEEDVLHSINFVAQPGELQHSSGKYPEVEENQR